MTNKRNQDILTESEDIHESCRLCGKQYKSLLKDLSDNRYGNPGVYHIGYCDKCGLGETFPKPQEDIALIYKTSIGDSSTTLLKWFYRKFKRSTVGTKLIFSLDRAGWFLNMFPPPSSHPKLLDIGCGSGDWLVLFHIEGYDASGIDLNPRVVEAARARGLAVTCRRIEELAEEGESFHVVVLSQVVEHLPDPSYVLDKIHKMLHPDGKLLLAVPNLKSRWRRFFRESWINWYVPFHLFHFTGESLARILKDCGFDVEKTSSYTPPSWLLNSIMLKYLDRGRVPNRFVNKWWHHLLLPFVSVFLFFVEGLWETEGDCLCILATKEKTK